MSVAGAVVLSGLQEKKQAGTHEISLNSKNELAAGVYIVQLEMNGVKMSRKLVIN